MADELNVAVIGAGTMGCGIAQSAIVAGHRALLIDSAAGPLERSRTAIERSLARARERGTLTEADAKAALARLTLSQTLAASGEATIVIEAVPENLALKRSLLTELARHLSATAIVASNTSAIRLAQLADALPDPARFVGLHYFFPAASNKLLEVVRGPQTSDATFAAARAFAEASNKVPLVCRDSNGFVVNRFFAPWLNEAVRLDDAGAGRAAIECAGLVSFGAPLGPFALMAATKTEIALHATRELAALGAFYEPAAGLERQVATGCEWTVPEPATATSEELVAALRAAVWFALGQLLDEGVCDARAIELGASVGLRWSTSPLAALRENRQAALRAVAALAARYAAPPPRALATL